MKRSLASFIAVYFITNVAAAQIYNSSITAGTAGSGRAAIDAGEPAFMNPATLVHLRGSHLVLSQGRHELAASISENDPDSLFPASLAYLQKKYDLPGGPAASDIRLTLAHRITRFIGIGVTGHYYQVRTGKDELFHQSNADLGMIYTPNPQWGGAIVAYDVAGEDPEMPEIFQLRKKTGLGFNWLMVETMRFRVDVVSAPNNNFTLPATMLGYETFFNKWVIGRLGYQEDRFLEARYGSLGLGLALPKFALNYAFLSVLPRNEDERHSIDLTISF